MTLPLILTHLLSAGLGAAVLWALRRHWFSARDPASATARLQRGDQAEPASTLEHQARERYVEHQIALLRRIELATKAAGLGVWDWDLVQDRLSADGFISRAFGVTTQDVKSNALQYLTGMVHLDDLPGFNATLSHALAGSTSLSHRYRIVMPDGMIRHVQVHAHLERDTADIATHMLGITTDVTAEMQRAEQLQQQAEDERALRERLNLATQTAGIGVWHMDVATRQITSDPMLRELLGVEGELNKLLPSVHPDDRDRVNAVLQRALTGASDETFSARLRIVRPDQSMRHVQAHIRISRNTRSRPELVLGVAWDVTNEVEHTEQLKQQAAHVQTLVDRLSVATHAAGLSAWEMDLPTYKLSWVGNRINAFGLDELPLKEYGPALAKLLPPEDRASLITDADAAIAQGKPTFSSRFRLVRDGTTRHMQTVARIVLDENGTAVKLVGATTDITNEVQTTSLLQRQAEQERALIDRLNIATEAAGISTWELDVASQKFLWVENPLKGMHDVMDDDGSLERHIGRIHPDDRSMLADQFLRAAHNKLDRISYRYRIHNNDGKLEYVQTHSRLLMDGAGEVLRVLGVSWKVTAEVEAAEKLEQQARHERMLLDRVSMATEAAGISSWEIDLGTKRFVLAEEAMLTLHGVDAFDGTIESFLTSVHPEDRGLLMDSLREALTQKRDRFSYRYRVRAGSSSPTHIRTHARLVFEASGKATRLLGVSWDTTKEIEAAERLAQQAQMLRDAERRLERASLSSSEGHWESDLIGNVWFSSSYHALLGYADGEMTRSVRDFELYNVHPDDLAQAQADMRQHLRGGTPFNCDVRLRTKTGEYRWFRQRGMAERDADGKALSMSGSIHEIHEQKLTEVALQLAQQRFERAINGTQDGLWELDANGAAWCSPRVAELLGYQPNALPNDTNFLRLFLHPDDAGAVAAATQSHFQQELPYDVEIRLQTKSGEYRWYRARATAERDALGRPLRLSGSLQDVTEARAAREDLLRATEAAEAANRAKTEFLANVSHEIRTPMNGIIGMTGLLLDTSLDRSQRDYAETIRSSADSLLIVINDILDFSKIEAGKLDIEAIDLDLRENVEDVATMMAFPAAAKNLELIVNVRPNVPGHLIGDPLRVRQCLINLVGNAIKFTRQGEIVIEVSNTGRRDGRVLTRFEVRDTGIGVAPETLQTLFQPFVQADSSTTRHFGGTGLGLSIVRRLVEMMGGQVGAHSAIGTGSSFWFVLPLEPVATTQPEAAIDLTRLGRRVLVVDDNQTHLRVLADQLLHAGYEVSLAGGGIEAIGLLRQALADNHPFEVVLADYQLHDMDGTALGEQINADPRLSRARIVMLTSMDRHGDIRRFASLNIAAYLTKPVRTRELFACMDRVLARDSKECHLQSQPIFTRGLLVGDDTARRYNGNVLLVEDNAVNQKVAVRVLERMGCKVRVADNGVEGVRACSDASYDLVLMDLQMPIMDGFTATRRIREIEGSRGQTPIVALTANAMAGQLERCMEAGMNGFLTKPLQVARLRETLDRYGLGVSAADQPNADAPSAAIPINLARLNEITDGDAEFARELATTFIASGEQVLDEVRAALSAFDRPGLSRAAHKLKGASANIHADSLRDLADALETQAPSLDQLRLKELIERLSVEFARAAEFLTQHAPAPAAKAG